MVATTRILVVDDGDTTSSTCCVTGSVTYSSSSGIGTINIDGIFFFDHRLPDPDAAPLNRKKEPFYYNQKKSYKVIQDKHSRRWR